MMIADSANAKAGYADTPPNMKEPTENFELIRRTIKVMARKPDNNSFLVLSSIEQQLSPS